MTFFAGGSGGVLIFGRRGYRDRVGWRGHIRLWRFAAFFLPQIVLVVAGIVAELAVFDLEDARGQLIDEVAVVRDEDDRAA